jgi:hypothetical protein
MQMSTRRASAGAVADYLLVAKSEGMTFIHFDPLSKGAARA